MKKLLFIFSLLIGSYVATAQIVANNDTGNPTNGYSGGVAYSNVLSNDTLDGNPVNLSSVTLTFLSSTNPNISLNVGNGNVMVAPGTQAGNYVLNYQICDSANTNNCDQATVTVSVTASPIVAINDSANPSTSSGGIAFTNVLANDSLNGLPVVPFQVTITMVSSTSPGVTLSGTNVIVAPGTPPGNYTLTYQICEILNPTNCDTATVSVIVINSVIIANDDDINVTTVANNFYSVLTNDTLNGVPVTPNTVTVTEIFSNGPGVDSQGFLVFGTGPVPIPPGVYVITYQICEIANPNNCDTANVVIHLGGCNVNPTITSIVQPNCSSSLGEVHLSNLPVTNWTITLSYNGTPLLPITGTGSTTILNNIAPGNYIMVVNNGSCSSVAQNFTINLPEGISVSMQGTYSDYNNDGFTNIGDVINYQITVTNNSCNSEITNIYLENANLNINGGPLTALASNSSDSTTFTASYVITQQDINAGSVANSIVVYGTQNGNSILNDFGVTNSLNLSDGIKFNAFLDTNSNGIQDGSEQNVYLGNFYYQMNNGAIHTVSTPSGVFYLYENSSANNYTIGYTLNGIYTGYYTVSTLSYSNVTVASGSGITTYNFPIISIPFVDVVTNLTQLGAPPRPGFDYTNSIYIANHGNQTISSGTVTFTHDSAVSISSVSVSGITNIPNGFTYNYTNLLPYQSMVINVVMHVPTIPTVSLGQSLTNSVSITSNVSEINLLNNDDSITQIIVGSYDPNDKQENHGGRIQFDDFTADDYLTYTIRFENSGTAEAINIRVEDVLDNQLDENSVRMVAASNDYVLDRIGSNLTWRFDGINLPPSVPDTQIGHGYITFQIKPKVGYAIGDIIPNTAEIYFDFNPAIVTNTCTTEFVETLANDSFAFSNLTYFPNPVKNSLSLSNTSLIDAIEITSVLGQKMLSQKVSSLQTEIDMSAFLNGIYFVKITSDGQEKTIKIVKE